MSKLQQYLGEYHKNDNAKKPSCFTISLGLGISMILLEEIFEEAERRKLTEKGLHFIVTGILGTKEDPCGGLYIYNETTSRGARLTRNGSAGTGRIHLGNRDTIPYPERIPVAGQCDPRDYDIKNIKDTAQMVLNHISRD